MTPRQQQRLPIPHNTARHRRHTEWRMILGGFVLIVVVGGSLLWLLWGLSVALIGLAAILAATAIFAVLLALMSLLEKWARS